MAATARRGRTRRSGRRSAIPNCSSTCSSSCSIRSAACALATSSRCSESVSAAILALSSLTSSRAFGQRARPVLAFGGDVVAGARRDGHRGAQPLRDQPAGLGHRGGDCRGVSRVPRGRAGRAAGPRARRRPPGAANPPVRERHSRVPRRCAPRAGPPPRRRGRSRPPPSTACAIDGFRFERRLLLGVVQPLLEFGEFLRRSGCGPPPARCAAGSAAATRRRRRARPGRAGRAARRSPRSRHRIR